VSGNATLEEGLRAAFAGRPAARPSCGADPQEIWRAIEGEATERETRALLAHAVLCADCDLSWRLGRELAAGSGLAAGPGTPPAPPILLHRARRWAVAGAVAVAAAAAVVLVPMLPRHESSGPPFREERGESVSSRVGDEPLPRDLFLLRWSAGPSGARYSLSVARPDLTSLYSVHGLETPEQRVPAEALAGVPAGGEVLWRVEVRLPDGRRLSSRAFSARVE
jgi:hypothetical protein